jgi:hypothetical protein
MAHSCAHSGQTYMAPSSYVCSDPQTGHCGKLLIRFPGVDWRRAPDLGLAQGVSVVVVVVVVVVIELIIPAMMRWSRAWRSKPFKPLAPLHTQAV